MFISDVLTNLDNFFHGGKSKHVKGGAYYVNCDLQEASANYLVTAIVNKVMTQPFMQS